MKIVLSPTVSSLNDTPPRVTGNVVKYRNTEYDLSTLTDGSQVEAELPFIGSIKNIAGEVEITLQYNYSTVTAEPMQSTSWDDYTFIVEDGQCSDPIIRKEIDNEH